MKSSPRSDALQVYTDDKKLISQLQLPLFIYKLTLNKQKSLLVLSDFLAD